MTAWLEFAAAAVAIMWVGGRLSTYADALAERLGVSRGFIGVILLGAVTSLPELITTISSIAVVESADLALGNVFGSNLFNVLIIALMDFVYRKRTFDSGNILTAVLSIIVALIVITGLVFPNLAGSVGRISVYSIVVAAAYLAAMGLLYLHDRAGEHGQEDEPGEPKLSLGHIAGGTALCAGVVVAAGVFATHAVDRIAAHHGLGESFAGGLFLAAATSLPELVVSLSALRLGATSMAAGNIFGSNLFNLAILPIADGVLPTNLYVGLAAPAHLVLGIGGIIIACLALTGIVQDAQNEQRPMIAGRFGIESVLVVAVYLVTLSVNYSMG